MALSSVPSCVSLDDSFGPHAGDCRGGFDFTLFFEETILTLLPICPLVLLIPPRIWYLLRRPKKVQTGKRLIGAKLVSIPSPIVSDWTKTVADRRRS